MKSSDVMQYKYDTVHGNVYSAFPGRWLRTLNLTLPLIDQKLHRMEISKERSSEWFTNLLQWWNDCDYSFKLCPVWNPVSVNTVTHVGCFVSHLFVSGVNLTSGFMNLLPEVIFFLLPGSHSLCVTAGLLQVVWHEALACAAWELQREGPRHLPGRKWFFHRNHLLLHAQS